MLVTTLRTLHVITPPTTLLDRYYYTQFLDGQTEAQYFNYPSPRSHSNKVIDAAFEPRKPVVSAV